MLLELVWTLHSPVRFEFQLEREIDVYETCSQLENQAKAALNRFRVMRELELGVQRADLA